MIASQSANAVTWADGGMTAVVCERYGSADLLAFVRVPCPTPKSNEILIRVLAATVTSADCRVRSLNLPRGFGLLGRLALGITGPRQSILGTELAGEIVQLGSAVTNFQVGDQVFAFFGARMGCHAEYRCMKATGSVAKIPSNLSVEQAAALCFGGSTMLDFYRRGRLVAGDQVLVNGASGGVGTAAVQLAKHFGAHVTAVCSTANVELLRAMGADRVIDYTQEDFMRSGWAFDVVVDAVGNAPFARSGALLRSGGRLLMLVPSLWDLLQAPLINLLTDKTVVAGPAEERSEYVQQLGRLGAAGHVLPLIDCCYPFERIADAYRYVDGGHKRGNVCISFAQRPTQPAEL